MCTVVSKKNVTYTEEEVHQGETHQEEDHSDHQEEDRRAEALLHLSLQLLLLWEEEATSW
jgi:hypothetical protein